MDLSSEMFLFILFLLGFYLVIWRWCSSKIRGYGGNPARFLSEDLPVTHLVSPPAVFDLVSVLHIGIFSYNGVEMRVLRKVRKYNIDGVVFTEVLASACVGDPVVHTCLTVEPGVLLMRVNPTKHMGEYALCGEQIVLSQPAFCTVFIDNFQLIGGIIEGSKEFGYLSTMCGRIFLHILPVQPSMSYSGISRLVVLLVEALLYSPELRWQQKCVSLCIRQHIYHERLNTLSGLGSIQSHRLILSSAQHRFSKTISQNTIYSSVRDFVDNSLSEFSESVTTFGNPIVDSLSEVPRVFDCDVSSVGIGFGWLKSEKFLDLPKIVDNKKLSLDLKSKGCRFENGILIFDDEYDKPQQIYFYGPHVASAALKYSVKSTKNVAAALCRMTNSRENELCYRVNQDLVCMSILGYGNHTPHSSRTAAIAVGAFSNWGLHHTKFVKKMSEVTRDHWMLVYNISFGFQTLCQGICDNIDRLELQRVLTSNRVDLTSAFASEEHDKRHERLVCLEEMMSLPFLWEKPIKTVSGKVKWEWAKHGKLCRQYVTLGCRATLYWPDLPRLLKDTMACELKFRGWDYIFIKECSVDSMDSWAEKVFSFHSSSYKQDKGLFFYHSDDSHFCSTISISGIMYHASVDLDIAKCDLSHGPGVFALLYHLCLNLGFTDERLRSLFDQLRAPIVVKHPDNKNPSFALFNLGEITLFSGHVLTTTVNNIGCLLIGLSIQSRLQVSSVFDSIDSFKNALVVAAAVVGYEVTIDSCTLTRVGDRPCLSTNTFLKHFIVSKPRICALKCVSTILRGYGISDDEVMLSTRKREIIRGLSPLHNNFILSKIFSSINLEKDGVINGTDEIEYRYGFSEQQILEGIEMLFEPDSAVLVSHPALEAILKVGYGLSKMS